MATEDAEALRRLMQALFRRFGVLRGDRTPCGQPLSVAHAHALLVLREQPALTQQALAAALGIDKSNVARLCAKMVRAGHARQDPAPEDRRSRKLSLTPRGKNLAETVDQASQRRFSGLLLALPEDSHNDVLRALELLVTALNTFQEEEFS